MKTTRKLLALAALFALAAVPGDRVDPPVGYEALADLDRLWQWTGEVKTLMSSSTAADLGNMDMSNFHGEYKGEPILAEIEGPGCVYRIWSAMPSGRIKVYLDGADKPEINCGFKDYLYGRCEGLPSDFAVGRAANYMPIPFQKSIVITAPRFRFPGYYQVSYQIYPPRVPVETFRKDDAMSAPYLEEARRTWNGAAHADAVKQTGCAGRQVYLKSLSRERVADLEGAGVIRMIAISDAGHPEDPLDKVRLRIYWDGQNEAAVDAPVDAFFVDRFGLKDQQPAGSLMNLFTSAGPHGYMAFFPMPFSQGARIELSNSGPARNLEVTIRYEQMDTLPANSMRFHARFNSKYYNTDNRPERTFTTHAPIDPDTNYVVLDRQGAGHLIGSAIYVTSVGTLWWGEGDEVTWVDGEQAPVIRGTGTEDEFNWSWGFEPHMSPVSGTLPVIPECKENIAAQIIPSLRNPECNEIVGHNLAYRFRPTDYVAFKQSIKLTYEIIGASMTATNNPLRGNWSQHRGDDYESMAYWYEVP